MITRLLVGAGAVALLLAQAGRGNGAAFARAATPIFAARFPPRASRLPQQAGPADSLYRLGREAINRGDFRRAAAAFAEISAKYPRSDYAPDAPYWRAFALYKAGREDDLRDALKALDDQQK